MKLIDASRCPGGVVDYLCSTSVYLAPSLRTLNIKLTTLHLASALHRSSQSGPDLYSHGYTTGGDYGLDYKAGGLQSGGPR